MNTIQTVAYKVYGQVVFFTQSSVLSDRHKKNGDRSRDMIDVALHSVNHGLNHIELMQALSVKFLP